MGCSLRHFYFKKMGWYPRILPTKNHIKFGFSYKPKSMLTLTIALYASNINSTFLNVSVIINVCMNLVLILCWIMKHVEALAVLLQGLCGSHRQVMKVHELCLKSGPNLGLSINH